MALSRKSDRPHARGHGVRAPGRRRLVCVTDVPTPYRLHLFEALERELAARDVGFEVLFMALTAPGRFWRFDLRDWKVRHRVVPGIHPVYRGIAFHLNPGAVWSVLSAPPTWLLVGGGWHLPTAFLLTMMASITAPRTRLLLWSEANAASMSYRTGTVAAFRRFVLGRADGFAVPGQVAESTILGPVGSPGSRPFLRLPNLVDERVFGPGVEDLRRRRGELRRQRGFAEHERVFLWPARLHEPTKGIMNFLEAVAPVWRSDIRVLVAGEGPDRGRIEGWLRAKSIGGVQLLGQQPDAEMIALLAVSDALILPSLADPNPLAVIEGLWAGLPLLVSNRCGNWPETLCAGKNGWLVDPASTASMRAAFLELIDAPPERLEAYGRESRALAERHFETAGQVRAFIAALLDLTHT